jgi:hypothetical protein
MLRLMLMTLKFFVLLLDCCLTGFRDGLLGKGIAGRLLALLVDTKESSFWHE